jgi:hypothetical protein
MPTLNSTNYINSYLYDIEFTCSLLSYEEIMVLINNNQFNIDIPNIGFKNIPKDSTDVITLESIKMGDILIDFKRDDNKSEYDYDVYYKESSLKYILETNKNPFTMETLNRNSIVKYIAVIEE